ncbi:MAG: LrgB family protein [Lachnospiraceae bacterium]|nr:LrgB family protein [Lachnospiraceae bacterium]
MIEFLSQSAFFGTALSMLVFLFFQIIRDHFKIKTPFFNPLLFASAVIIIFLKVSKIDYESYNGGAKYLTYWLTPMTICLAIPLYRRVKELKDNILAIIVSVLAGAVAHVAVMGLVAFVSGLDKTLLHSVMPNSVTTAIALGLCEKMGGIAPVTIVGVTVAGMTGAVLGPFILKIFKISDPIAQGLAMGSASHAVGTSKAMEMGELQGAMSSLAIVVTGIITVVVLQIAVMITG